jgi:hypothetical protein
MSRNAVIGNKVNEKRSISQKRGLLKREGIQSEAEHCQARYEDGLYLIIWGNGELHAIDSYK